LQLLDLGEERADDGLRFRRLPGDQFFREVQRHALHGAERPAAGQTRSRKTSPRAVAGYAAEERKQRLE
jgi:hypothetical protein